MTKRGLGFALALLALGVGACAPAPAPPPPPRPVFDYAPSSIEPSTDPTACRTILVLGDSLATEMAVDLPDVYADHGYCATVVDGAVDAANTMATPQGQSMSNRLAALYNDHHPDAVVFSFVGNVTQAQATPAGNAYKLLIEQASSYNLPVFVTTPPVSAALCNPNDVWTLGHVPFRSFVRSDLPALVPYTPVRWSEVLTPGGTWAQFNDSLRFPDGVRLVRSFDCLHLGRRTNTVTRGELVAATEIVAATQTLWVTPEPPVISEVPEPDPAAAPSELPPPEPVG